MNIERKQRSFFFIVANVLRVPLKYLGVILVKSMMRHNLSGTLMSTLERKNTKECDERIN